LLSGLTTTVCVLASAEAAHHCCADGPPCSTAEGEEGGCHCPSCALSERSSGYLQQNLIEARLSFPLQDFSPPRTLRSAAIDYPPEFS